ncbi:Right-handed parallel beta-helix repeat-containing protein [Sulfidibacter corallicola]|uniref:Right-handed parallel beta-helix repeat-containing protein n=1 Tax=Sulfidibacter corallicola TaxID=2818388 RepID=A0A8A4TF72_SULCO|nr:right-handed parallel beta-helix repeat-containing protein [Sulfidibacter corallicola]QTD48749.1 right-handed parallel beta-helix repeat-containing protein [Sulfidibacter corallicola]
MTTFTFFVLLFYGVGDSCDCYINPSDQIVDFRDEFSFVQPGDTLCILGGLRGRLKIMNFHGEEADPIRFVNVGGQVVISTDGDVGLHVVNSRYIQISGTGDEGEFYGIRIDGAGKKGMQLNRKTSHIEVDHVEIANIGLDPDSHGIGLVWNTHATCPDGSDTTYAYDYDGDGEDVGDLNDVVSRENFTQSHGVFHDLYIHDTLTEGMYLGLPYYLEGHVHNCQGGPIALNGPVTEHIAVYDNVIENTGYEGINVKSAVAACQIMGNRVTGDSLRDNNSQNGGIALGPGCNCEVFNNRITDGKGKGIFLYYNANGSIVFNNTIIRPGSGSGSPRQGIEVNHNVPGDEAGMFILNNTIVSPTKNAIKLRTESGDAHLVANNLIIQDNNYDVIKIKGQGQVDVQANQVYDTPPPCLFTDVQADDLHLSPCSPAIDQGIDTTPYGVSFDFDYQPRPQGAQHDVGAFEHTPNTKR